MRWSKTLLATLREDPKDAEIVSHKLMMRSGLLVKLSGGLYSYSPLGVRVLHKVEKIVREEMDRAGASEVLFTALQPIELWEESGRAGLMGKSMFRLKDRNDQTMVLGPTHEEVATDYLRTLASSYRQLPATVYQIQTKFRDEIRPRFGLMRCKEFVMKDAYSFDLTSEEADVSYKKMYDAYLRIFARCGLDAHPVEADTGSIGGSHSHEFMVLAPSGEDGILFCPSCRYAANQERAERRAPPCDWSSPSADPRAKVATPGAHTVDEAAAALGIPSDQVVKSLVYLADGKPVMVLLRGNADLCEPKLRRRLGCAELEMADPETTAKVAGPFGSIGPIGVGIPVYADVALKEARDVAVGAGEDGFHVVHCNLMDDADVKIASWDDLATVVAGDLCPHCGKPLALERGIEVGHVFKLGLKYTASMGFKVLDAAGKSVTPVMGCYGIGVSRTVQAIAEQNNDKDGIVWPASVSPCQVALLQLDGRNEAVKSAVDSLEAALEAAGIDVLVDDRDERPGIKFKDADLIGCTVRATIGARSLEKGGVEVRLRRTGETELVPLADAPAKIAGMLAAQAK
ncbi:MAG: proline--tRNA ligase [Kiritimatiellae bacterium]|nr:proline--tRNA ligase [Kiritimatiellia bacterium]